MLHGKSWLSFSMLARASPMLVPGSGSPLIDAVGYMLQRVIWTGPALSRTSATALSGTMSPSVLRTLNCLTDSASVRKRASACTFTCQVRPKRLKSLT